MSLATNQKTEGIQGLRFRRTRKAAAVRMIKEMVPARHSFAEIGRALGVSRWYIAILAREAGVVRPPKRPCASLESWLRANGFTYEEFGASVGVSAVAVWKWIRVGCQPHPDIMKMITRVAGGAITEADWRRPDELSI